MTPITTTLVILLTPIIPRIKIEQQPEAATTTFSIPRELTYKPGLRRPKKLEKFMITSCNSQVGTIDIYGNNSTA